jgi:DNA-binding NarL/FixJ family response regulator
MRILVADDHETLRRGLRTLLEQHDGWQVWEASNGRDAVELAKEVLPRVVVLDISMPQMNGFEAIHHIKRQVPNCEVLVFTIHDAEDYVIDALRAGALGYLPKSDAALHITAAVEALSESKPYFSASVSKFLLDIYTARARADAEFGKMVPSLSQFSTREREVIQLVAEGRSNRTISALLGISLKTVDTHRSAAMRKAGTRSVADLVRFAVRMNVIEP